MTSQSSNRRRRHPLAKIKGGWTQEEDDELVKCARPWLGARARRDYSCWSCPAPPMHTTPHTRLHILHCHQRARCQLIMSIFTRTTFGSSVHRCSTHRTAYSMCIATLSPQSDLLSESDIAHVALCTSALHSELQVSSEVWRGKLGSDS